MHLYGALGSENGGEYPYAVQPDAAPVFDADCVVACLCKRGAVSAMLEKLMHRDTAE